MTEQARAQQPTIRPDPDPTVLTTAALMREVATLKENLKELFQAKLDAVEKTLDDVHDNVHTLPEQRALDIEHLERLISEKFQTIREKFAEKFTAIDQQFKDRDLRAVQSASESKEALAAALQAAKEAVGEKNKSNDASIAKSDFQTTKLIDGLSGTIKSNADAVDKALNEIKERMNRYESAVAAVAAAHVGSRADRTEQRASTSGTAQIVGIIIAAAIGLLSLAVTLSHTSPVSLTH